MAEGALIGEIPTIDGVSMTALEDGQEVRVEGGALAIEGRRAAQ